MIAQHPSYHELLLALLAQEGQAALGGCAPT